MADTNPYSKQSLNNALGVRDATRDIAKAMKAMGADVSNFSRDFSTVTREANNFATYQANAVKSTSNVNKLLEKANTLRGIANKQESEAAAIALKRSKVEKSINELTTDKNNKAKKLTTLQKNELKNLQSQSQTLKEQATAISNQADNATTLADQFTSLGQSSQDLSRNIYGGLASMSKFLGISDNLTNGFEEANEIQRQKKIIIQEELILQESLEKALKDYNQEMKKTADMKEFLADEEGLTPDRIRRFDLTDATGGASGTAGSTAIGKTQDGMRNTKSGLGSTLAPILKGIGALLKTLAKSLVILKAMSFVADMISYAFFGIEQEAVDLAKSMNMGRDAGFKMRNDIETMKNDMKILGANTADAVKFQVEFTKHTGTSARLNKDQLVTAMLMTKQMGLTNDQAINLIDSFKASGMGAREGLDALKQSYNQLFNTNKTAMNFNQLMEDITSDTELQYIFQTKGAAAAMKTANAVRRTGLSLSQQRSMAEGTLDFEKTMTAQLELQMLTGKNINLNKAQELALQGRNGEAVAEMQKQMSGLTAEQRKNPLIMNKMLELLGMSREEYYEQQNAIREQNALIAAQGKLKKQFNEEELGYFTELEKRGKDNVKSAIAYAYSIDEEKGELMEKELAALENRMVKEAEAEGKQVDLVKIKAKAFEEFHATELSNAKVRYGIQGAEIKQLESQMTAADAFNEAMNDVKEIFAELVGSGSIQYLTDSLIDFVTRAKQVGFGRAILGGGDSKAEIAEDNKESMDRADKAIATMKAQGAGEMADVRLINSLARKSDLNEAVLDKLELEMGKDRLQAAMSSGYTQYNLRKKQRSIRGGILDPTTYTPNQQTQEVQDFILRPGQPPIKFDKGDLVMGGTQLGMGGGKVEQLLEQLLAETKAGKVIKMDTATVARSLQLNATKMSY